MDRRNEKAITLIALVVTIVVLLILAGISISMLTGENGIIKQAQESKDKTGQSKVEEAVKLAINGLLTANKGDKSTITPEMIANQVNKDEKRTDVTAEGTEFPTNIIFEEEGRKVGVDINLSITQPTTTPEESEDAIFSNTGDMSGEELLEEAEKNVDLFEYEIIDDGSVASIDLTNLPTKTAKITRIKPIYCSGFAGTYNEESYENTNYAINYKGEKITDTLVIPYQVEIDGEMYKITEANITALGEDIYGLPRVQTIIYPNTIEKIEANKIIHDQNNKIQKVILPKNLKVIGEQAFYNCTGLTSITIPNGVTSIGSKAFYNCTELTNIVIPEGVTSIEASTFDGCKNLSSVIIPNSVSSIGNGAFSYCVSLGNIQIPSEVTNIEESAFNGCTGVTSIKVDENNTVYDSRENSNALIKTSTNTLIRGCNTTTIPNGITEINKNAFDGCTRLTSITIPASVTLIEDSAFSGCAGLTNIKVDENNTIYDSRENSNALIKTSTNTLIKGCNTTNIPSGVTSIGSFAFNGCTGLTSITIPESVTSIGSAAFNECTGLTSITIPESVTSIGYCAFCNCTNLSKVYFKQTTAPTFGSECFKKYSEPKTIFYFKNETVYNAFTTSHYNSSYGEKSTNYDW